MIVSQATFDSACSYSHTAPTLSSTMTIAPPLITVDHTNARKRPPMANVRVPGNVRITGTLTSAKKRVFTSFRQSYRRSAVSTGVGQQPSRLWNGVHRQANNGNPLEMDHWQRRDSAAKQCQSLDSSQSLNPNQRHPPVRDGSSITRTRRTSFAKACATTPATFFLTKAKRKHKTLTVEDPLDMTEALLETAKQVAMRWRLRP